MKEGFFAAVFFACTIIGILSIPVRSEHYFFNPCVRVGADPLDEDRCMCGKVRVHRNDTASYNESFFREAMAKGRAYWRPTP